MVSHMVMYDFSKNLSLRTDKGKRRSEGKKMSNDEVQLCGICGSTVSWGSFDD